MKKHLLFGLGALLVSGMASAQWNTGAQGIYYAPGSGPDFVGIGTSSPTNQLTLNGVSTNTTLGGNTDCSIKLNNWNWNYDAMSEIQFTQGNTFQLASISAIYEDYGANPGGDLVLSTSPKTSNVVEERLRVTRDGYVGIGTSTPGTKLEVYGGDISLGGQYQKFILHTQTWNSGGSDLHLAPMDMSTNTWDFSKQFTFGSDGDFDVYGSIYAEEVVVQLAPFPDYVFDNDYDLMSLGELDNFISENGHLPNIPSAEEVEENNIGMGELQRLQMEKIEELTLYILAQQKEIDELKSRLQ